jgi:heptosyltransferase-1
MLSLVNASPTTRILVIKLSSLGDLFNVVPAVHGLKVGLGASIDWVTQPEYVDLVRCFDDVDDVISFPRRRFLAGLPKLIRSVRERNYDYVIDLQGLLKSALTARLARGRTRIGPSYRREGSGLFYHRIAGPRDESRHAVKQACDILKHLQLAEPAPVFPVTFPPAPAPRSRPAVALIPRSRWTTKNWPIERFAELARALRERLSATVVLAGAPEDRAACDQIAGDDDAILNLAGTTGLPELGGVLSGMDLVITVDTGPMHMAAASGVPVLALFGATDPGRTGPYGAGHEVLTTPDLPCRPCRSRTCARGDLACLQEITIDQVFEKAQQMLNRKA